MPAHGQTILDCPNVTCQRRDGFRRVMSSSSETRIVHMFRQAKFVELNLLRLAVLPFLHCQIKQTNQQQLVAFFIFGVKNFWATQNF